MDEKNVKQKEQERCQNTQSQNISVDQMLSKCWHVYTNVRKGVTV